jgi:type IV secretion system protein VirB5
MLKSNCLKVRVIGFAAAALVSVPAFAVLPVIDGAHIATAKMNNMEQIAKWVIQLERMKTELEQTKGIWDTLKGGRGMGNILREDLTRQFLPQDYWAVAELIRRGGGDWNGISGRVSDIVKAYQYKSCGELNKDPVLRQQCERQWRDIAMSKDFGDLSYKKAAENITNLQQYVRHINTSTDQKEIAEIQARINVENARLQNEQIKLATIAKMEETERQLQAARVYNAVDSSMANFNRPDF